MIINGVWHFRIIEFVGIPSDNPQPIPYILNQYCHICMLCVHYKINKTQNINSLSIPLHFEFTRFFVKIENAETTLNAARCKTPCECMLRSIKEMYLPECD